VEIRGVRLPPNPLEWHLKDDPLDDEATAIRKAVEHARAHPGRYRA
jgi:hypothetical protein